MTKLPKVYVIGDSISMQYGPYLEKYLTGDFIYSRKEGEDEALLNLDTPQGANGGDSSMVLTYLNAVYTSGELNSDLLLLNCGLHDIKTNPDTGKKQIKIDEYRENLLSIVTIVKKMGMELVWIRTTPCDENVHNKRNMSFHRFSADCISYNIVADEVMSSSGVSSIDLYTFTLNIEHDIYCDHVHFIDHIREKQASFIAGWLNCWKNRQSNE